MRITVRDCARWIAAALLIALLVPSMPAHFRAATLFTVSTTSDSGVGSLRDAIIHANANPGATIAFAIPNAGVQTITLAAALPNIAANVTIDGTTQLGYSGAPLIAIDGATSVTDLTIASGVEARLRGLSITRGQGGTGGGILNNGTLTLDLSSVTNNSAASGPASGGGINNTGALTVIGSTISGNSAGSGAGIFSTGRLTLTASTVNGNNASGLGGGLLITGTQSQTIINSTITGNIAASGGGIDNQGALVITNSTISANHASVTDGGGIKAESRGIGVTVTNTIIADNSCLTPTDDVSGTFISGGHNLIGFTGISIGFGATGDVLNPPSSGVSPTLADNGGPTMTLALQSGSQAIGAGDPSVCAASPVSGRDQRGVARLPAACTIGAFEYRIAQSVSVAPSNPTIGVGGTTQFTATLTFTDTMTQEITTAANWGTGDSAKATVVSGFTSTNPGLVTGTGVGSTAVSARFGSVQGSGAVTIIVPTPVITSLTPPTVTTTSGTITLTVTGSGFVPSSVVHFTSATVADTALTTAYRSGTQIQATIPGGDLTTTGTAHITVVNPAPGGASNAQTLTLTPGSAIRLDVSGFPPTTTAGVSHLLTVTAKDSLGNIVTSDNDTLSLSSSDFSATLPLTGTLINGVGTFPITLKTTGMQTIVAVDLDPNTIVATQSGITVTPASPASIVANTGTTPQSAQIGHTLTFPFAVIVRDAFGNVVPNVTVIFSQPTSGASGSFAALATVTTNGSGVATAPRSPRTPPPVHTPSLPARVASAHRHPSP
ncbi:MAG: right-handed parallel beta-helix repeat-containing protein [Chloroflexota bacterium]|nr:right-handed parallel beta-helix repeat-containing protein [Chloroflexota bacterium]